MGRGWNASLPGSGVQRADPLFSPLSPFVCQRSRPYVRKCLSRLREVSDGSPDLRPHRGLLSQFPRSPPVKQLSHKEAPKAQEQYPRAALVGLRGDTGSDSKRQFAQKLLNRQAMMSGHVLEHAMQQPHFQRAMIGNGDMMFAVALGGHLNVRPGLPSGFVAEATERTDKFATVAVAGNFHAVKTSSRT